MDKSTEIINITEHLQYQWENGILIYTTHSVTRANIDAWFAHLESVLTVWEPTRPFLMVQDLSVSEVAATPYAKYIGEKIFALRPDVQRRFAVVLGQYYLAQFVKLFLRTRRTPTLEIQVFHQRDAALEWVQQQNS